MLVAMDPQFTTRFLETVEGASKAAGAGNPHTILLSAFQAIIQGDFDSFGAFLTDDVELRISGTGIFDGVWQGRKDVVQAARNNFGLLKHQKPEIEAMIAQGDMVAVLMRESGILKTNERNYQFRGVQWFTLAGGRIHRIEEIMTPSSS